MQQSDAHALRLLADQAGKDFQGGGLFHTGAHTIVPLDPKLFAVPLSRR